MFFQKYWPENMGPRREKLDFNSGVPIQIYLLSEIVLNFRRVTAMLDLVDYLLLDEYNLPLAVYLSSVQTQQQSRENLGLMRGDLLDIQCQLYENVSLLNQRRVAGHLELGEFLLLDTCVSSRHSRKCFTLLKLMTELIFFFFSF